MSLKFTAKQEEAQQILSGDATHICLFGGSRSGKTFLLTRNVIFRSLMAPGARSGIFRFRLNAIRASIVQETFPKVMKIAFPEVDYQLNKSEMFVTFENESEIWFGGLDDKERTEKVLGKEFVTLYLNECSQIPLESCDMVMTRLAQRVYTKIDGREPVLLKTRGYYDCNPPNKAHWTYKRFILKQDPVTKEPLKYPDNYVSFKINPSDNVQNLSDGYIDILNSLSARLRKRFLEGEFADATPNQLFSDEIIDTWRVTDGIIPDLIRIVVAVDPSGSGDVDNADNDAIGICIGGLGIDGNVYLLEDATCKCGPATWGKIVADAFDRHGADIVVGEGNFGGAMVQHVIQTARPRTPYKMVSASRGKAVRAEPFSALYEQGKVRHVGRFMELEDELTSFSTVGYLGEHSPNRADALIWMLAELFPAMVRAPREIKEPKERPVLHRKLGWMG